MSQKFDVVIVGTGFASSFFLFAYLQKARPDTRILVLERGRIDTHAWQLQNRHNSSINHKKTFKRTGKPWAFTLGFGGGSNCWWACTPRMLPNDFRLQSTYGVGVDWPISYDDLEPYYSQAEAIMAVSGPDDGSPFPRSAPYPQPPHRFTDPDNLLKAAYPDLYFHQPTARARVATRNRGACCASGVCSLCPANAKFTILNEMQAIYQDRRVTLVLEANAQSVEISNNRATGVRYIHQGAEKRAGADLVVLGANAIFNPFILLRSGLAHPLLGKRLHEQVSVSVLVDLAGVDNFQGSTSVTGNGYMLYDGKHRSQYAACLIESYNIPHIYLLRTERGKWRQRLFLKFIFEDLPGEQNYVRMYAADPNLPETVHSGHSAYTQRAIDRLPAILPELLKPLPVEQIQIDAHHSETEAHILGTTLMGNDPQSSIVDRQLVHHQLRNLLVLGSSVFPTGSPANPTLTLSALSLWAADHLF